MGALKEKSKQHYSEEFIDRYLYNELSKGKKSEFEEHLKTCKRCRKVLNYIKNVDEFVKSPLKDLPRQKYLDNLAGIVLEKIEEKKKFTVFEFTKKPRFYLPVSFAAAALIIFFVAKSIRQYSTEKSVVVNQPVQKTKKITDLDKLQITSKVDKDKEKLIPETPEEQPEPEKTENKETTKPKKDEKTQIIEKDETPKKEMIKEKPNNLKKKEETKKPTETDLKYNEKLRMKLAGNPLEKKKKGNKIETDVQIRNGRISALNTIANLPEFARGKDIQETKDIDNYLFARDEVKKLTNIIDKIDYWLTFLNNSRLNPYTRKLAVIDIAELYYVYVSVKPDPEIKKEALELYKKYEEVLTDYYGNAVYTDYTSIFEK